MRLPTSPRRHSSVKTCQDYIMIIYDNFESATSSALSKFEPDGFPVVFCRHFWLAQFRPSWRWVILFLIPLPYRNTRNPVYRIPAYYAIVCPCTTWTFQTCSKMFSSFLTNLQAPEKVCAVSPSCCLGQVCDLLQPPLGTIGTICPVECAGTAPDTCILASWKWGFTEVRWDSRFM